MFTRTIPAPRDLSAEALERLVWIHRPNRGTFLSRFWTVPAHRDPIGRRMAALNAGA